MSDFAEKFKQIEIDLVNEQRRVSVQSCLKVFYGITIDKHYRISFISSSRPQKIISTKEIKVTQGMESDSVYWTCFDLMEDDAKVVFFTFCNSLIESIEMVEDEQSALAYLKERFYAWKSLLKSKKSMPYELYQGLYGELYFLLEYIAKKEDINTAINCWVGPDGYSKDFSINETWYEVKTIGTSSNAIKINSIAQLESNVNGHLVSLVVERMSSEFASELNDVSSLYNSILSQILDRQTRENFINKVLKYGYSDEDEMINNQKFEVKKMRFYLVDDKFPKLTSKAIKSSAITNVTYELLLSSIDEFKENDYEY